MITIDEMEQMLDEIVESLPPALFEKLNGGVVLLPEARLHEKSRGDDLYILGQYHHGGNMGRYIEIFYGSFIQVYGRLDKKRFKNQLAKTVKHEFIHHLESMAGERGLEREDARNLADYLDNQGD